MSDNTGYITLVNTATESPFRSYSPRPDTIRAVKLTKDNLKAVGAYMLKALGGKVEVTEKGIFRGAAPADFITPLFVPGEWVIEEYDYERGVPTFRRAGLVDRQKYDLR